MKQYINITIIHYIINKIKSYINRQLKDISGDAASQSLDQNKILYIPAIYYRHEVLH